MSEQTKPPHTGKCCWYLDRKDDKYKCALNGCTRVMETIPDEPND